MKNEIDGKRLVKRGQDAVIDARREFAGRERRQAHQDNKKVKNKIGFPAKIFRQTHKMYYAIQAFLRKMYFGNIPINFFDFNQ